VETAGCALQALLGLHRTFTF